MSLQVRILFVLSFVINSFGMGYFADKLPAVALLDGVFVTLAGIYAIQEMEPYQTDEECHATGCKCNDKDNCSDCGCMTDSYEGAVDPQDWKVEDAE